MTTTSMPEYPRPAAGEPRPYAFPRFERVRLDNGLRLVVAPVSKLPLVTVLAVVDAGAEADPAGREGVARLTAQLLAEGTERLGGAELTEQVERLGAGLDASADWDSAVVRLSVLAPRLHEAMALLGEVLTRPGFREREVARLRNERLAELLQVKADPGALADLAFTRLLYAPDSRYALPAGGSETSVATLDRAAVMEFYSARYQPASTTLVVVGDVSVAEAERLARETLGRWRGGTPAPVRVNDQPAATERRLHLVAKPDAQQSELRLGHVGLSRSHPDYFPVTVMNALLGGLFSSRINLNLRERHGYTYGAHSSFDWRHAAGPFEVSAAVQSEVTHLAAREALGELTRFADAPVEESELCLATDYLDGVFPIRFETTTAIAGALAAIVVHDLPDDWYDTYRPFVRAVMPHDVQRAARDHLHPDR
ncbi:MAG TPA: pitrilysin family protein, partial [Gemmatimonadaceae bacterium]|nr:pitrilysin family protein [Gemmatimonadaceae bacterium]